MSSSGPPLLPPRRPRPGSSGAIPIVPPPPPRAVRGSRLPWVCLGFALMLLAGVATLLVARHRTQRTELTLPSSIAPASTSASPEFKVVEESAPTEIVSASPVVETLTAAEVDQPTSFVAPTKSTPPVPAEVASPTEAPAEPKSASAEVPLVFKDLQQRQFQLNLPSFGLIRESAAVKLAALPVPPNEPVELLLLSAPEAGLKMTPTESEKDKGSSWTVNKLVRGGVNGKEEVTLGQFTIQAGELRFQWSSTAAEWCKLGSLQFAKLEIHVGPHRQECRLWKPVEVNPARLTTKSVKDANLISIPHVAELVDRPDTVQWEIQLSGLPYKVNAQPPAKIGETILLTVDDNDQHSLEVELKMTLTDNRCELLARIFGQVPTFVIEKGKGVQMKLDRKEINRVTVNAPTETKKLIDETKKLGNIKKPILADIKGHQTRLRAIAALLANPNGNAAQGNDLANEQQFREQKTAELQVKLEGIDTELTTIATFQAERSNWRDAVLKILDTLEDRAELRYAVRVQAQQLIPIVMTSGFEGPLQSR